LHPSPSLEDCLRANTFDFLHATDDNGMTVLIEGYLDLNMKLEQKLHLDLNMK
jgi:hypothetical protein